MAALTTNRDTKHYEIIHKDWLPLAAGAKVYKGGIVVIDATGYGKAALTATGLIAAGRSELEVDNSAGAAGQNKTEIRRGIFLYANSAGGDAIAITDRYKACYIVDDQTVAKTDGGGTRSRAGRVVRVEPAGVWVHIDPLVGTT